MNAVSYFKITFACLLKIENVKIDALDIMCIYFSPCSHHARLVWEVRRYSQEWNVRRTEMCDERNGENIEKGITIGYRRVGEN